MNPSGSMSAKRSRVPDLLEVLDRHRRALAAVVPAGEGADEHRAGAATAARRSVAPAPSREAYSRGRRAGQDRRAARVDGPARGSRRDRGERSRWTRRAHGRPRPSAPRSRRRASRARARAPTAARCGTGSRRAIICATSTTSSADAEPQRRPAARVGGARAASRTGGTRSRRPPSRGRGRRPCPRSPAEALHVLVRARSAGRTPWRPRRSRPSRAQASDPEPPTTREQPSVGASDAAAHARRPGLEQRPRPRAPSTTSASRKWRHHGQRMQLEDAP